MSNQLLTKGRVALITGAAMGVGRASAIAFAKRGLSVVAVDLPGDELSALEAELTDLTGSADQVLCIAGDLAEPDSINRIQSAVSERFKVVNVLMNNAVTREGRTFDCTTDQWKHLFEVNVWALVESSRRFLPAMLESGERCAIVNVGSKQGITNPPGTPAYNMAKAAVKIFTEQLEHDIRNVETNNGLVTAHLLVPGWTTTGKNEHKQGAWLPVQVVNTMIDGIDNGSFYIVCPDDEVTTDMDKRRIIWGAEDITHDRPPLSRWHKDFSDEARKKL